MINDNIRKARKAKGMSQEELAVQLNVVRQTVSKWENGLSVPDADVLVRMAGLLDVPVEQLLGLGTQDEERQELAERLAQLNEQLARKNRREKLMERANGKRGMILFLAFAAMMIALAVKNEVVSLLLCGGCILAAAWTVSDFKAVSITVLLLWIGIPGGISLLFFWKKMRGRI